MSASFSMISFLCYMLQIYSTRSTPSEPKSRHIPFRKHTLSPMFTNQINSTFPSKRWISNTPTEEGDHSHCHTTAKENQQPPSNPKANWRLTAFFTLGINHHVSWTKTLFRQSVNKLVTKQKRKEIRLLEGRVTETITPSV
jgi:hypothetical protein